MSRNRVLVADDDDVLRLILSMFLGSLGYQVTGVASGAECLALAREDPPDILLLDVMMPGLSGIEVAARLERDQRTAGIPVILMSGAVLPDPHVGLPFASVRAYLIKPFSLELLRQLIGEALRLAQGALPAA